MTTKRVVCLCAAILVALIVFVPTSTRSLSSNAKPATDYDSAIRRARALELGDSSAASGGKSMLLVHGHRTPRVFIFFHGLTNSPRQYRALADSLYQAGDNVFVPRLPWHGLRGGTARDLGKVTAGALRDVADASVDIASGLGDTIVVFGVSLGGNVAAWVAQFRGVDRVVIAAPALGLSHLSTILETLVINVGVRVPNYSLSETPDPGRPDRAPGWSTRGIAEMMNLGLAVRRRADDRAPLARDIRVLANASDETINRSAIDELVRQWSTMGASVTMYELSDTLHLPHDIVDPDEPTAKPAITEPVILALLRGVAAIGGPGVRVVRRS